MNQKVATPAKQATPCSPGPPPPATPHSSDRRTSKVARLPRKLRELVNVMLSDGVPYAVIIKRMARRGHHLNHDNLSRWFTGGHQDWLKEQAWLEEMRARLDFASDIVTDKQGYLLQEASLRIAVIQMYKLLTDFDPAVLKPKLAQHPGAYSRILGALCKLTEGSIKLERHRLGHTGASESPFGADKTLAQLTGLR